MIGANRKESTMTLAAAAAVVVAVVAVVVVVCALGVVGSESIPIL